MKLSCAADNLIFITAVIFALSGYSMAELEQSKNRRGGGTSGLYAFPRVGRSDPSLSNSLHEISDTSPLDGIYPISMEEYEELPKSEIKRASLIAFPRVGRTDSEIRKWARLMALQQALEKRTGPSATTGLWFGPRLGKRSVDPKDSGLGQKEREHY